jgi:hypothetical protein
MDDVRIHQYANVRRWKKGNEAAKAVGMISLFAVDFVK